jgi:acetoin utilization deacetylase AcuC-like enzyme
MLRTLDDVVTPAVDRFAPTWVLVSAGYDAHRADPMAGLDLTAGDFADIANRVKAYAPGTGRLALLLEGGYDLDALRLSVGSSLAALLDVEFRPEQASSGGPGDEAVDAARRAQTGEESTGQA